METVVVVMDLKAGEVAEEAAVETVVAGMVLKVAVVEEVEVED